MGNKCFCKEKDTSDFSTAARHGLDSVQLQTVRSSKRFCADVEGSATAAATHVLGCTF